MFHLSGLKRKVANLARYFPFSWRDLRVATLTLTGAICLCSLVQKAGVTEGFAFPVFLLAVLVVSRFTTGYLFGVLAALFGVVFVNYIFTFPYWELNFTIAGYPLTFMTFLVVSVTTSALVTQVREQERMRGEAEREKMRANLLRSVSHDIRTPLTAIIGATSTVRENPDLPAEMRDKLLGDVQDEAQWLIRVVENLLSITRIGESQIRVATELEMVEEVVGEAVRKFRRRFPQVAVVLDVPAEIFLVPMDGILVGQVISNLMENAVLHGGTTTQIRVTARGERRTARFSVEDNGQGFCEERLPELFSGRVRREETGASDGKRNMGLGLSVCLAIVRAHGGTMEAGNRKEGGAKVSFSLPLDKEET